MFPIYQKELPSSAAELTAALTASLRRAVDVPHDPVLIRENRFPDLSEIAINLSGAKVRMDAPRPIFPEGKSEPAIIAQRFNLRGEPVLVGGAAVNIRIDATGIVLHQGRNEEGTVFLLLQGVDDGKIAVSIQQKDLETLIRGIAKTEAGKQGVTIENVQSNLTSRGPRSLGAEVRLQARKFFVRATIRLTGTLQIDEELVAHLSDLNCTGDGAIATLACSVLAPHLQKLQGRNYPLLALPLGEVRLRDINLDAADGIRVTAAFSGAQEHGAA